MKLYYIKGQVKELPSKQVAIEKELQKLLEDNMFAFFGVTFLKSEYRIINGRMDSIGIDENNCPVIFEYKRGVNENVINQGLFYLDCSIIRAIKLVCKGLRASCTTRTNFCDSKTATAVAGKCVRICVCSKL